MDTSLSERIRAWRAWLGVDQKRFAEIVGVTAASVSGWEKGHYEPGRANQEAIADALGITRQRLLFGDLPDSRPRRAEL